MAETHFLTEKAEILDSIKNMWEMVSCNLKTAFEALHNTDSNLTYVTIRKEETINKLHMSIESIAITFMATQQPVASNLRMLVAIFKIARSLERIGDYAIHIAKEGKRLEDVKYPGNIKILEDMIEIGIKMLDDTEIAFKESDSISAREIAARDDLVDAHHREFITDILENISKDPDNADMYTRLVSTVNSVERLCDHITDICESLVYMTDGRFVDLNEK